LGIIRTTGLTGLWVTLLPAAVGLVGMILLKRARQTGLALVALYSAFWLAVGASALPTVWNAKRSFCLNGIGFCITSPWLGRIVALTLLTPFLLVALWSCRLLLGRGGARGVV
jgi:hypothetical protein